MPSAYDLRPVVITHDPNQRVDTSAGKLPAIDPLAILQQAIDFFETVGLEAIKQLTGIDLTGIVELLDAIGINLEIPNFGEALQNAIAAVAQILNALQGIDLSSPGAVVDSIQAVITAFVASLLGLIGDIIPVVGTPIEQLGLVLLATINNGIDALQGQGTLTNQIGSLQNQINSPVSIPIPLSAHDGESSVIWENCDTDIVISPTTARGAFIRPRSAQEKTTLKIIAYKGSGCTGIYFDLVKLDPLTGGVTRVYQSVNEAANLASGTTSADYTTLTHTAAVDAGVVVADGDNWAWQISTVGGDITVRGKTDANPALTTRPLRYGFARTIVSGARMPTSLTQTLMDGAYNAQIPYIEWDIDKVVQVVPRKFFDAFERDLLGDDWVSHRTTLVPYGISPLYLTIAGGRIAFTGTSFVGAFEGAFVRWPATMGSGGMRVTVQVRNPSGSTAYFLIAGATDWSSYVAVGVRNVGLDISTGAGWTAVTTKASSLATVVDGDYLSVDWVSGADRYDVYQHTTPDVPDGATPVFSWTDGSHVVPHGAAYQYAGAMLTINGYVPSASFDSFGFKDVGAVTPTLPPPTVPGTGLPHGIPFRLPAPSGHVGPIPLAVLELTSPPPAVLGTIIAPLAVLELTSPTLSLSDEPPVAPLAILELTSPAPTGVAAPAQFTDAFNDLSAWTLSGTSASTKITADGKLNLLANTSGYVTATTNSTYNMTGKIVQIEVVAHSAANHVDHFQLANAGGTNWNSWFLYYGTLYAAAGGSNIFSVTFDATTHRYLRLRQDAGGTVVYYDHSADGVSWTNDASGGTLYPLTAAYVRISYSASAGGDSAFDNLIVF